MQTRKGAAKDTLPSKSDAFHSRLNCGTSTSAPARNVKTIPAKVPMKASQSGTPVSKALPTTTPSASSISATEIPSSTEIVDAARIAAARITATASSLTSTSCERRFVWGRGHQPRRAVGREPHRAYELHTPYPHALRNRLEPVTPSVRERGSFRVAEDARLGPL